MFPEAVKEDFSHCLKCGMCQSTCPTFRVMRQEHYAPRGRVQIIKHYLDGDLALSQEFKEAVMSCILCDACAAGCPSRVRIDRLLRNMRIELVDLVGTRIDKKALFTTLSNPSWMRTGAAIARWGQRVFVEPLKISLRLGNIPVHRLPRLNRESFRARTGEKISPRSKRTGKVLYFTGCATDMVYEDVGDAVVEVLGRLGIEVIIPRNQVCCSAPMFLNGAVREALPNITRNLDILDLPDADAIVVDCATCAAALKKGIPDLLEDLGQDTEKARRVAAKVRDVSQIVAERVEELDLEDSPPGEILSVTYHDPCHMVRGLGVTAEPRKILRSLPGTRFVEMEGAAECCGGGGTYQFEHVELSAGITSAKKANIRASGAEVVATGCPGCRVTLTGNLSDDSDPQVTHTVQILAGRLKKM